ncbi:MAG: RDD family protein [Akkermansiaceae bacterium]|nr:RDD family protein [Akkermansiaceae bacterium]
MNTAEPKLDTLQAVELAEGVEIRLRMAGPMLRMAAYLIDCVIKFVGMMVVFIVLMLAGMAVGDRVMWGMMALVAFFAEWFYPMVFEVGKRGATPGKRMVGLRVVQVTGSPLTLGQAFVRNILRWVDALPLMVWPTYGVGMVSCLATRRFQRLGDLAAGTVVIYDRQPLLPVLIAPPPITAVPLPVGLTSDETRTLVLFRERAGLWSAGRRQEIGEQAECLSGARGAEGVSRLMAMAHWVQEKKQGTLKR